MEQMKLHRQRKAQRKKDLLNSVMFEANVVEKAQDALVSLENMDDTLHISNNVHVHTHDGIDMSMFDDDVQQGDVNEHIHVNVNDDGNVGVNKMEDDDYERPSSRDIRQKSAREKLFAFARKKSTKRCSKAMQVYILYL